MLEQILKQQGYEHISLATNISIYFSGEIREFDDISTKEYINQSLWGVEDLSTVFQWMKNIANVDAGINIVAIDNFTNNVMIYMNPMGLKSLYINDENLISPSINSLINERSVLDYQYLGLIKKFGYNQNDLTPWTNIQKLLPGYIYTGNKYTLYKELTRVRIDQRFQAPIMLPKYLEASIEHRLTHIPDETIGVLLSGGLDSSVISALLVKANKELETPKKLRFFTTENEADLKYAKEVAEFLDIDLEIIPGNDVELLDEELFEANETPIDLGSTVPNIKLFKRISSMGIKTIFTGDGPDEMFRGYKRNAEQFDYHMHDMKNELVYYHFPRLEKAARFYGINLITPYLTPVIWTMALTNEIKMRKADLKEMAHGLIPESVIDRPKEPLKNKEIRENKQEYQTRFLNRFILYANNRGESTQTTKKGSQK